MLCGTTAGTTGTPTGGVTVSTGTDSPLDCGTALQEYQQNTDCLVEDIGAVTPDSMACSSECKMLAYNLADACQGVRLLFVTMHTYVLWAWFVHLYVAYIL